MRTVLLILVAITPLHAQAPAEDVPMFVTGEQRARIAREFAQLSKQNDALEEKLYNCQTANLVGWRYWWRS
jgi:hypothetical protein